MKKLYISWILLFFASWGLGQNYLGLHSSPYAGLYGIDNNPATIVQGNLKFELNFLSNNLDINTKNVFLNKENMLSIPSKKWLTFPANQDGNTYFSSNTNLFSFAFNSGKKMAFAFTFNHKTTGNIQNFKNGFSNQFINNFENPPTDPLTYSNSNSTIDFINWAEAGLTIGRVVFEKHRHSVKLAARLKALIPMGNLYFYGEELDIQVNPNQTVNFENANFTYGYSNDFGNNTSANIFKANNILDNDRQFSAGFDIGVTYEYRPNSRYLKDDAIYRYKWKVGISMLNVGSLNFDYTDYTTTKNIGIDTINISYFDTAKDFGDFLDTLKINTTYQNKISSTQDIPLTVRLPHNFNIFFDYQIVKGLFLNVNYRTGKEFGQFQIGEPSRFSLTIRWEGKQSGIYLPISYIEGEPYLGVAARLSPLVFGVSNVAGLLKDSGKGEKVSMFLGVRVPVGR